MILRFDSFQVDLLDERLWRGAELVHLTRKAWGALRVLVESNGRLVTKEQLIQTVWESVAVGDDSLTKAVREVRRALGDDQRAPRFIATVHGRGYRFTAPLHTSVARTSSSSANGMAPLIGRERELATLRRWLDDARLGGRQVGVVSGHVGIGKSRLVGAFLDGVQQETWPTLNVAVGRCVEQHGASEPFLPVIAALRHLARVPSAAATIVSVAPPWLAAACGLDASSATAEEDIKARPGVLRVLAEVFEAIANAAPLALVLKDLHWSDPSTLDLINLLARRTDPARLLVLCTLRYSEALSTGHPSARLVREMRRSELCREIALTPFTTVEVDGYLAARLGGEPPRNAVEYLGRHTGGNPFFLRALTDDLLARNALRREKDGWVLRAQAPPAIPSQSLAALAPRLERLSERERTILETASVIGNAFAAEAIAAASSKPGIDPSLEDIEAVCDRLARHQDILRAGADRAPYRFQQVLYRQALYEGIPPARRRRLHRAIAEWLVRNRPADSSAGAAEFGDHLGRAGDHAQAADYLA